MAEPVEVAVLEHLARLLGQLRRLARPRDGSHERVEQRAAVGARRAHRRRRASSDSRVEPPVTPRAPRGGSPPPATNVRVMSAQQREARSRGQMSTTTGSPARDLAVARLVPDRRLRRRGRRSRRRAARSRARSQTACIALAHVLATSGPARSSRISSRGDAHRRVGGLLGAPDARRAAPAVFDAAGARRTRRRRRAARCPPARRWSATATREVGRHDRRGRCPSSRHARSAISTSIVERGQALRRAARRGRARRVEHLDARARAPCRRRAR